MNIKESKYLEDNGAEITKQIQREQVKNLKIFVGEDYRQHFDEVYDRIHERGYGFSPFLSMNPLTNGNYFARLDLRRMVPQEIFSKPIGERVCPYGGWFTWTIGLKHEDDEGLIIEVIRELIDPTRTEKDKWSTFLKDSMTEVYSVGAGETQKIFRRETLKALSQLRDFSHLRPEPSIIIRDHTDYADFIKSFWRDYGD